MAKKVIFEPEDFDKPQKEKSNKKLAWGVGICAALVLIGIGGYALLAPKTLEPTDEAVETTISESGVSTADSEDSSSVPAMEAYDESNINPSQLDRENQKIEGISETNGNQKSPVVQGAHEKSAASSHMEGEALEKEAMKVIRGDYGDGSTRRNQLGNNYNRIQNRVNELKKKGVF